MPSESTCFTRSALLCCSDFHRPNRPGFSLSITHISSSLPHHYMPPHTILLQFTSPSVTFFITFSFSFLQIIPHGLMDIAETPCFHHTIIFPTSQSLSHHGRFQRSAHRNSRYLPHFPFDADQPLCIHRIPVYCMATMI
jgi:hypothetical protein